MTKRTRLWWLLLAGILAGLLVLAIACGDDDEEEEVGETPTGETPVAAELQTDFGVTDTEITLGMNIVQSGNLAATYSPISPAMTAYFSKVNAEDGGVCGRSITFIVEDDQYSPSAALERARKLVDQDGILAFVGNLGTGPTSVPSPTSTIPTRTATRQTGSLTCGYPPAPLYCTTP